MKRLSLAVTMLFCFNLMFSQSPSYVDFEWDIFRFGYALPLGGEADGGLAFGGELRYNATDNFSIGIGGNGAVFGGDIGASETDFGITGASLLLGDYYFSNTSGQRAFAGVGIGLYSTGTVTVVNNNVEEIIEGSTGVGLAPRVGYEFNHIRLQGQYNLTFKEGQSNYFGVTVALTLWGGYKGGSKSYDSGSNRDVLD